MAHDLIFGKNKRNFSRRLAQAATLDSKPSPGDIWLAAVTSTFWHPPAPVPLDASSLAALLAAKKTVNGIPLENIIDELKKSGKITITSRWYRIFFGRNGLTQQAHEEVTSTEKRLAYQDNRLNLRYRIVRDLARRGDPVAKRLYKDLIDTQLLNTGNPLKIGTRRFR